MTFHVYMLHCAGGNFYVGQTDNLERRFSEHESGLIPGYTQNRRPVKLVWTDSFQTRDDAKVVEKKLKGWTKAKKLALIRGNWDGISLLARNRVEKEKAALRQAQGNGGVGA
jgi:predicted GIY-YIG superfamily endonuclease